MIGSTGHNMTFQRRHKEIDGKNESEPKNIGGDYLTNYFYVLLKNGYVLIQVLKILTQQKNVSEYIA